MAAQSTRTSPLIIITCTLLVMGEPLRALAREAAGDDAGADALLRHWASRNVRVANIDEMKELLNGKPDDAKASEFLHVNSEGLVARWRARLNGERRSVGPWGTPCSSWCVAFCFVSSYACCRLFADGELCDHCIWHSLKCLRGRALAGGGPAAAAASAGQWRCSLCSFAAGSLPAAEPFVVRGAHELCVFHAASLGGTCILG